MAFGFALLAKAIASLTIKQLVVGALVLASTAYSVLSSRRQQKELEEDLFRNRPRFGIRDTPSTSPLWIGLGD